MSQPVLAGEPVTVSAVDPKPSSGSFALSNPGDTSITVAVDSLWFEAGSARTPIAAFHLYQQDERGALQPLDPAAIELGPRGARKLLVSFAPIEGVPGYQGATAVALRLRAGAITIEARSPVTLERRWPGR